MSNDGSDTDENTQNDLDRREIVYRVVLIDDESWTLAGLEKTFRWSEEGFVVVQRFTNARDVLGYLAHEIVDVIFTDIRMPGMTGLELLQQLREKAVDAEVVIVSGFADFEYAKQAMRWRAMEYLVKPVSFEDANLLLHRLGTRLDEKIRNADMEMWETLVSDPEHVADIFAEQGREPLHAGFLCLAAEEGESEGTYGRRGQERAFHFAGHSVLRIQYGRKRSCYIVNMEQGESLPDPIIRTLMAEQGLERVGLPKSAVPAPLLPGAIHQALRALSDGAGTMGQGIRLAQEISLYQENDGAMEPVDECLFDSQGAEASAFPIRTESEMRSDNQTFSELLAYMQAHYSESLQLRDLAARYHISLSYCCLLFQKTLKKTFSEHLTDLRMKEAALLLRESAMNLSEISEQIGFRDYYYFIRVFKKYHGITPSRFRKGKAPDR